MYHRKAFGPQRRSSRQALARDIAASILAAQRRGEHWPVTFYAQQAETIRLVEEQLALGIPILGETLTRNQVAGMALIGLGLTAVDGRIWRWAASFGPAWCNVRARARNKDGQEVRRVCGAGGYRLAADISVASLLELDRNHVVSSADHVY